MDIDVRNIVGGYHAGKKKAEESLAIGKRFLGAWGVCEALGYERNTMMWEGGSIGALEVFSSFEIWVDGKGLIVGLEKKGA